MNTRNWIAGAAIAALMLAGCAAEPPKVPDNGETVTATTKNGVTTTQTVRSGYALQTNAVLALQAQQKPIFEMEALEGQVIELKGVKRLAVYAPGGNAGQGASALAPPPREVAGWEKALMFGDKVFERGLQVMGLVYNKQGVIAQITANRDVQLGEQTSRVALVDSVGGRNAQIAGMIQAPAGTTTTTTNTTSYDLTGSFLTLGDGSPLTHSSNNPVRTCTGGSGASSGAGSTTTTGAGAPSGAGGSGGTASC